MLFVAIVCASVALSSFAQSGEDYSLNVIGFQKVTVVTNAGGLMLGSNPFLNEDIPNLDNVLGANGLKGVTSGRC